MDSMLKGLFGGGDDDRTPQARDFINRFEQGPIDEGYSDQEAFENYQRVAQHADPETMQRAAEQTFARMDPRQRAEFAQMLQQRMGGQAGGQFGGYSDDPRQMAGMVSQVQRESPGGLACLFGGGGGSSGGSGLGDMVGGLLGGGGNGFPGGTLGKVALGGIAAYAMKEVLDGGGNGDKKRRRSV